MKSLTTEVLWPCWEWGPRNRPDLRYVSFSYSADLTIRDNRKARTLIGSEWYQGIWGDRFEISSDQDAKTKFENDKLGFKLATSVGGLGTGERGDRVIVDDPHNVKDGESTAKRMSTLLWFTESLPTRVNDPNSTPIIVIMQRVHDQDVSGLILSQELGYEHLMLPMEFEPDRRCYSVVKPSYIPEAQPEKVRYSQELKAWQPDPTSETLRYSVDPRSEETELLWPDRMDRATVERDKKVMGDYAVASQFQQRPVPRGGGMFKREHIEIIDKCPRLVRVCRGWDLASSKGKTSPYTAGVKIGLDEKGVIVIVNARRLRGSPGEVDTLLSMTAEEDGKDTIISIPQDPGQAGKSQKVYLAKLLMGYNVRFSPESGSKEVRAEGLSAQAEAGNVKMVRGDWNYDFLNELCLFPMSTYKDQVDAASRAFAEIIRKKTTLLPAAPESVAQTETSYAE